MLNVLKQKTKVILDTNFLMIPGELGVDVFSEVDRVVLEPYELCIVDKTMEELETLIMRYGKKKEGFIAKLGLIMAKQKGLKTLPSSKEEYVDAAILKIASKNPQKTIIATQDKQLQGELKKISTRIITLRQKKYLELR